MRVTFPMNPVVSQPIHCSIGFLEGDPMIEKFAGATSCARFRSHLFSDYSGDLERCSISRAKPDLDTNPGAAAAKPARRVMSERRTHPLGF